MYTLIKTTLAAGASALALTAGAGAQSTEDLEARLAQLEAMVADLRSELDAARSHGAETEDRIVRLEAREPAEPVTAAQSPDGNGFMAGNTRVTYGGFIDVDAHVTDLSDGDFAPTSIARDFYIPGATPVGGSGDSEPDTDFTAQGSRFFFATETPTDLGAITSRIEFDFLGSPEGELALAQAAVYLATAPKSNAVYVAWKAAMRTAKEHGSLMPPKTILNAPTRFMKEEGYGAGYAYDHDAPDAFSGQDYWPDALGRQRFYQPVDRGFEREIGKRLEWWERLRRERRGDDA